MLKNILEDLLKIDDILFVIKNGSAVSEIRSNLLKLNQKDNWITIGDSDGPCHMHINADLIKKAKFVVEDKPERTSYSVRFFDEKDERVLGAFFTNMYDKNKSLKQHIKRLYDDLYAKYGSKETLEFVQTT